MSKYRYICGDGRKTYTLDEAKAHANWVFQRKGIIISVESL